MDTQKKELQDKIRIVTMKLQDLKQRWPAHSVKPAMVEELDRLEDELEALTAQRIETDPGKSEGL